jgi:hypothetical protein
MNNKGMFLLAKILAVLLILYFIKKRIDMPTTIEGWSFKGPVEKIWYDDKHIPFVLVNGVEYNLYGTIWHFGDIIHVGDTIIKQKGDRRIRLIRRNTKDTVFYNTSTND